MMDLFLQQLVNGLSLGALYALIAVGYTVVYGIVQLINFAHGEIFMVGAFGAYTTWVVLGRPTNLALGEALGVVLPLMILGGVVVSVTVALLMERLAYRPLRGAPRLAPLITAIGISISLQEIVRVFFGRIPGFPDSRQNVAFPTIQGISGASTQIGDVQVPNSAIFTLVALAVCTAFLWYFVNRTAIGRAMQATSQDPDTARLMGINVDRAIITAFGLGAVLAAIAGVAHGLRYNAIDFQMGFLAGMKAFTAAVLGGIGNIPGAFVGSLLMGEIDVLVVSFLPMGSRLRDFFAFFVLIIVFLVKPTGIFGEAQVEKV